MIMMKMNIFIKYSLINWGGVRVGGDSFLSVAVLL